MIGHTILGPLVLVSFTERRYPHRCSVKTKSSEIGRGCSAGWRRLKPAALEPIQIRYREIMAEPGFVAQVLANGAEGVTPIARDTANGVRDIEVESKPRAVSPNSS